MKVGRNKQKTQLSAEHGARGAAFYLFCCFIVSYFTHLPARVGVLGTLHFDFLLAVLTSLAIAFSKKRRVTGPTSKLDPVSRRLLILVAYIVVTIPFVEWPGSVVHNLESYLKALCFFFFVVAIVDTTHKLRVLLTVYVTTQLWRVFEPLFMHLKSGYWGSSTSLGNWEYMDRLAGSPYDIINPNGLGFVIIMALPLLHLIVKPDSIGRRLLYAGIVGAMCYTLVLTASRSSFLALIFLGVFVAWRSKHRAAYLTAGFTVALIGLALMTGLQRERYVSIFSHSAKGGATAEERFTGVMDDFKISLRHPLFGHGLGTSSEANAHFRGVAMPSHNLYTEVAEELGYVGLALVLALIWSFVRACWRAQTIISATPMTDERLIFLHDVAVALVVVVAVDLFFSFASFGFSEPYWYFLGGLSVTTAQLAMKLAPSPEAAAWSQRSRTRPQGALRGGLRARSGARRPLSGTRGS
jgi:putative inorganic carbon (hco3(-)) transporter